MTLRIAVLSDVHANPFALEAVVEDIARQRVDEVLLGGDLVGRGPLGSQVLDMVKELGWPSVRGNHEDYTLSFRRGHVHTSWLTAPEWAASRWMAAELRDDQIEFIDALPFSLTSAAAPSLRVVHGSPASNCEGIGPWTSDKIIQSHLSAVEESLLVCAHTHRPMIRQTPGGLVVNVGSVGLPFNADPRAQYAIFTRKNNAWSTELRQVDYDREAFYRAYETSGFKEAGGITADLLLHELRAARPYLVPYIKWAGAHKRPPTPDSLADFLNAYDPSMSRQEFARLLCAES